MSKWPIMLGVAIIAIVGSAISGAYFAYVSQTPPEMTTAVPSPDHIPSSEPEAVPTPQATAPSPEPSPAPAEPTGAGVRVQISSSELVGLDHLVDGQGMTLYVFSNDTQGQASSCVGDCALAWPPFLTEGEVETPTGLETLIDTIAHPEGGLQARYNGSPLYFYSGDVAPGDVQGHGVGGAWFVVSI